MSHSATDSAEYRPIRITNSDRLASTIALARGQSLPLPLLIIATKPCYIKLAPLIRAARQRGLPLITVDTGHHYSEELTGAGRDFGIVDDIDFNLNIRGTILGRSAELALKCEEMADLLRKFGADVRDTVPLVSGDTSTSATFPLFWYFETGARCVHIEAGLRSRSPFLDEVPNVAAVRNQAAASWTLVPDDPFPEGVDTRVTSTVARRLFAPLANNADELMREGYVKRDILVTGSLSADAVAAIHVPLQEPLDRERGSRLRFDVHRRENMTPNRLEAIVDGASRLSRDGYVVSFVLTNQIKLAFERLSDHHFHKRLDAAGVECAAITPSYATFLRSVGSRHYCALVTDSGGLQEESAILAVPCCTLRFSTDRPETVRTLRTNILAPPVSGPLIADTVKWFIQLPVPVWEAPYGTAVADCIVDDILAMASLPS